jgi:hypothetical protein
MKEADFASLKKRTLDSFINALEAEKGSTEIPEPPQTFEIPGFISESDLPEWEQKISRAAKSGIRFFRAGGIHALTLLKNIPEAQLTGVFPLSVTNSQCAALLKENGFVSAAFSPELPPKTIPELLSRSPLPLYRTSAPVPLLVSRTKLAPEGIWQERSGTKLRLDFDPEEKLWKLWHK